MEVDGKYILFFLQGKDLFKTHEEVQGVKDKKKKHTIAAKTEWLGKTIEQLVGKQNKNRTEAYKVQTS